MIAICATEMGNTYPVLVTMITPSHAHAAREYRMNKRYIGDSVYVYSDGYGIILMTENGLPTDPSNTIYLDPQVYQALVQYVEDQTKQPQAGGGNDE
jgi:hypothetical protein